MSNDLWGYNSGEFDDDPFNWDDDPVQKDELEDIRSIIRAAQPIVRNGRVTDGVSREAPYASAPAGRPKSIRRGYSSAGERRTRRKDGVAGAGKSNDAAVNGRGDKDGDGAGPGEDPALSADVTDDITIPGAIPAGRPREVLRRNRANPTPVSVPDRVGTRNQAKPLRKEPFTTTRFSASIKDLKFVASGDMECRILIPYEDRASGQLIADAWGLDVEVIINRRVYDATT